LRDCDFGVPVGEPAELVPEDSAPVEDTLPRMLVDSERRDLTWGDAEELEDEDATEAAACAMAAAAAEVAEPTPACNGERLE
jgi:hypothetical protein